MFSPATLGGDQALIILILEIMIVEGYYYCISFTDLILIYYRYIHHDANDGSGKRWKHGQLFFFSCSCHPKQPLGKTLC